MHLFPGNISGNARCITLFTASNKTIMKEILTKLKLIDHLNMILPIRKDEFVRRLSTAVDEGDSGIVSNTLDTFSFGKNIWKGTVNADGFYLLKKTNTIDIFSKFATANGTFIENNGKLNIDVAIESAYYRLIILYLLIIIGIYSTLSELPSIPSDVNPFFFLFLLIPLGMMLVMPYYIMRQAVKRLKHDLERELVFHVNKT